MTGTTHTSSQHCQDKFDNDEFSIGVDNHCYVTMLHCTQDFVVPLKKVQRVINWFKGQKVHTIYAGTITWNINNNYGYTRQV